MRLATRIYITGVVLAGALAMGAAMLQWSCPDPVRFSAYLALTALASLVKLRLPGITGTYSLNSVLLLVGITNFTMPETVLAAGVAVALQQFIRTTTRPTPVQFLFNLSNESLSVALCSLAVQSLRQGMQPSPPAVLGLVAALYFAVNTVIVSGVLSLLEGKSLWELCRQLYYWSFPYYLIGVAAVGLLPLQGPVRFGESWLILLPLVYLVHFFTGLSMSRYGNGAEGSEGREPGISHQATMYLAGVIIAGFALLASAPLNWESAHPLRFLGYLALAAVTATWKVRLPKMTGTISVSFVTTLFAVAVLSLPEASVVDDSASRQAL